MNAYIRKFLELPTNRLVALLTVVGMLLAVQINYIQHGWINNDSVLYFEAARLFSIGEWQAGFKLFEWPLYSALIALTHKLTGFQIHFSAQILNVIFFGMATTAFLKLIQHSGGDNKTLLAGSLILFSAQYVVGDVLQMLMRDQGFWAFFLISLVFFIRFYRHNRLGDAVLWQFSAIIAMLFRVEGISYLALLPLALLFRQDAAISTRLYSLVKAHCVNIVATIGVALYISTSNLSASSLGRLNEVLTLNLYEEITKKLLLRSDIMADKVLGNYLDEFAIQGLILTFIFVMLSKVITAAGWISIGLAAFATKHRQRLINDQAWLVLRGAMLIAAINMFLIITKVFVLSSRYVVALALVLMVIASFGLRELFRHIHAKTGADKTKKWILIILLTILTLGAIKNVLPKREGYNYQQDAVAWLKANNPENLAVLFDSPRVRYYSGAPYEERGPKLQEMFFLALNTSGANQYEFLVINFDASDLEQEKLFSEKAINFHEVARFYGGKKKKYIAIYQKKR